MTTVKLSLDELENLNRAAHAGYELAKWAAAVNWDGARNQKDWLFGLRLRILLVAKIYEMDMGIKPEGGQMQVSVPAAP